MRKKDLFINTQFSESDAQDLSESEDRNMLDFHEVTLPSGQVLKCFHRLNFILQDNNKNILAEGFRKIDAFAKNQLAREKQHLHTQEMGDQKQYHAIGTLGKRFWSHNNGKTSMPQVLEFKQRPSKNSSSQSGTETLQGKTIISKLNNLQKLIYSMRKQAQMSNMQSVVYQPQNNFLQPSGYMYSTPQIVQSTYIVRNPSGAQLLYDPHVVYNPAQPLPNETYIPQQKSKKLGKSQRLKTEPTVKSSFLEDKDTQQAVITNQLREIRKEIQELISINKQIIMSNSVRPQPNKVALSMQPKPRLNARDRKTSQLGSHGLTTQPTHRSQGLSFRNNKSPMRYKGHSVILNAGGCLKCSHPSNTGNLRIN